LLHDFKFLNDTASISTILTTIDRYQDVERIC